MYYSRKHYQMVSPKATTRQEVAERIRYRKAAEQALAETFAKYPTLTAENFADANAFRERRTQAILAGDHPDDDGTIESTLAAWRKL